MHIYLFQSVSLCSRIVFKKLLYPKETAPSFLHLVSIKKERAKFTTSTESSSSKGLLLPNILHLGGFPTYKLTYVVNARNSSSILGKKVRYIIHSCWSSTSGRDNGSKCQGLGVYR